MTNSETISWPKDFPDLKRLDNLLRCGICYDYMKNVMMTSCSHSYCSLCIRKYMQYKSVCPTCFEETFEVSLRSNRPLDEIISVFTGIRDKIIRHLKLAAVYLPNSNDSDTHLDCVSLSSSSSKRKDESSQKIIENGFMNYVGKGKNVARRLDNGVITDECENGVSVLSSPVNSKLVETPSRSGSATPITKIPSMFCSPKKSVPSVSPASAGTTTATVSCPVCSVNIPERNINIHLDNCLSRVNSAPANKTKVAKRDPIPKRVYSLMHEKDLRKWLKTYGLSINGDKKTLISRLQRYTVLYNSECDSDNPRPVSEIIRQVEKEEKDEKSSIIGVVVKKPITRNADPSIIDTENKKYIEKNKSHFETLINTMRERDQACIRPTRLNNRINSDSDDENFCSKDTLRLTDIPSTSENHQLNGTSIQHCKTLVNDYKEDSNDVIEIHGESPDLSYIASHSTVKSEKFTRFNIEAEVCVNENFNSSLKESKDNLKIESPSKLSDAELELSACDYVKNELDERENDSDNSSESISLLADYKTAIEENKSSLNKSPISKALSTSVFRSQITDPDFTITESELISTNMSEESEDMFVPVRRSKRQRCEKVDDLPKRGLRRKNK